MMQTPLAPAPDVDKALLVRQALDMDWPPGPAVDVFLEHAIERLIGEPMPMPVSVPSFTRPEAEPKARCPMCGHTMQRLTPYVPRQGSVADRALAALRAAGRPMCGRELSRVIGATEKGGIAPYLVTAVGAGVIRRHVSAGRNPVYEAVE